MSDAMERLGAALSGRYSIERELGEGGMATVYLAGDLRHDRRVALKVLKPELAAVVGAERFLAEIKTTANLQHPHVLPLFDSGEADSFLFYVMPWIEGESLRERLEREQQLPVEEALGIAEKVAAALQYAHEQGVVHRDIKPANILLSRGEPLVADFGIALAVSQAGAGRITETGLSLGTPHYMSPEQAAGERTLDKRSDVYALGCVLYEMLTGQPPFGGPNAQAVLGRILTGDPDPVTTHRRTVPANVEAAVHRSLQRLPADRFESARAFAAALRDPSFRSDVGSATPAAAHSGGRGARWLAGGAVAVAAGALLLAGLSWLPGESPPVRRYNMELSGHTIAPAVVGRRLEISPDGSMIVYSGLDETGATSLWLRPRSQLDARPIPGTERAGTPVFSPDGQRIAFITGNAGLAVTSLGGEPPITFPAPGNQTYGLDWGADDRLYYAGSQGIFRIPAGGGEPERVTQVDTARGEFSHAHPTVLPDARGLLYAAVAGAGFGPDVASLVVMDLESGEETARIPGVFYGMYASSGHLVVVSSTSAATLMAVPFDLSRLEIIGDPVALAQGVGFTTAGVDIALSDEGTLVYRQGAENQLGNMTPLVVGRSGAESVIDESWRGFFVSLAISPDGERLATTMLGSEGQEIWIKELGGGPAAKRTFEPAENDRPAWTPDGRGVIFFSGRQGGFDLWQVRADGNAPATLLLDDDRDVVAADVSRDGAWLVYRTNALQDPGADILARRLDADGRPEGDVVPLLTTPAQERAPSLSPDARWLAYVSNASGRDEIYVVPFPDVEGARWQISIEGGTEPLWSRGGGEIFYRRSDGALMAAEVRSDPTFSIGQRRSLFAAGAYSVDFNHRAYDVLPGDTAFIFLPLQSGGGDHLIVVDNLFTELREKVGR